MGEMKVFRWALTTSTRSMLVLAPELTFLLLEQASGRQLPQSGMYPRKGGTYWRAGIGLMDSTSVHLELYVRVTRCGNGDLT